MATFTKLLEIKMVAKSFCGYSSSFKTLLALALSFCLNSSTSCGSNEKKATSDAETNAEQNSNRMPKINDT